jgi:hypothetical protein
MPKAIVAKTSSSRAGSFRAQGMFGRRRGRCDDGAEAPMPSTSTTSTSRSTLHARHHGPRSRPLRSESRYPGRLSPYNQYAIDAFERGAVDYLPKPIRRVPRVARLKERMASGANRADAPASWSSRSGTTGRGATHEALQWITASVGKETRLIMVDDVAYFQADNGAPWS